MKHTRIFLILFAILTLSVILAGSAAAQDVDVSSMSNEEIKSLIQSIMQKLEQDKDADTDSEGKGRETAGTLDQTSETDGSAAKAADPEVREFSIYENKKLVIGRLPDSWFISDDSGDDDDNNKNKNNGSTGFHYGGDIIYPVYGLSYDPPDIWISW